MFDKEKGLFEAFVAKKMSRRELIQATGQGGPLGLCRRLPADPGADQRHGRRLRLDEVQGLEAQASAQQAPLCRCHDRQHRDLQDDDRHGHLLGHLPRGRLLRQGDGGALVRLDRIRRLHDRRLHDLDLWSGRLDHRPQRVHQGPGQDQSQLQLGRHAAGPARLDLLERRSRRRAGSADAKQWCIPWGYELNNISYNKKMFDKVGVQPPKNLGEMVEVSAKLTKDLGGPYGIGVRGSRSWASIHPGFLSGYANFGERDFTVTDGKLKAAMNTAGSKSFHKDWVKMIQEFGPEELVDLHLVPGRHRPRCGRFRHDLRRRHSRLLHERRRQQGERATWVTRRLRQTRRPPHPRPTSGSGRWP